mmetsp:Transcript_15990/g.30165  ORF Transcript_15990/g.30165 Transcript_15990/m.30165 type:complete len:80 (+) Transcript_15990:3282-3521(+)
MIVSTHTTLSLSLSLSLQACLVLLLSLKVAGNIGSNVNNSMIDYQRAIARTLTTHCYATEDYDSLVLSATSVRITKGSQ